MDTIGTFRGARRGSASGRTLILTVHAAWLAQLVSAILLRLDAMLEKRRSRLALLELNDDQLKDIGISRADACREAARPFWD